MNAGLIATRYARTLLLYSREEGIEEQTYQQARSLLAALGKEEELGACVEGLSPQMRNFITLVIRNKRTPYLSRILHAYSDLYRKEHGITKARIVSAVEDPGLEDKLKTLLKLYGYTKVDFESEVDPGLIGGFVLSIDDKRLDASIARELAQIRHEFEEKNRKLS